MVASISTTPKAAITFNKTQTDRASAQYQLPADDILTTSNAEKTARYLGKHA